MLVIVSRVIARVLDLRPDRVPVLGSALSTRCQDCMTASLSPYHLPHAIENAILCSIGGATRAVSCTRRRAV